MTKKKPRFKHRSRHPTTKGPRVRAYGDESAHFGANRCTPPTTQRHNTSEARWNQHNSAIAPAPCARPFAECYLDSITGAFQNTPYFWQITTPEPKHSVHRQSTLQLKLSSIITQTELPIQKLLHHIQVADPPGANKTRCLEIITQQWRVAN